MIVPEKGNGGNKEQKQNDHADHNSDHLDHVDKDDFIARCVILGNRVRFHDRRSKIISILLRIQLYLCLSDRNIMIAVVDGSNCQRIGSIIFIGKCGCQIGKRNGIWNDHIIIRIDGHDRFRCTENIAVAFKKVGIVYCIIRFILCHIDPAEVIETVVK